MLRWVKTMEFCSVITSTTLTELKVEETTNHFYWFAKLFLMGNVSLSWGKMLTPRILKFGIPTKVNAIIFLQKNMILFVVSSSMKNKSRLLIEIKILALSYKSAALSQETMSITTIRTTLSLPASILTLKMTNFGSLSSTKDQEVICSNEAISSQFRPLYLLSSILIFKNSKVLCKHKSKNTWRNILKNKE